MNNHSFHSRNSLRIFCFYVDCGQFIQEVVGNKFANETPVNTNNNMNICCKLVNNNLSGLGPIPKTVSKSLEFSEVMEVSDIPDGPLRPCLNLC